MNEPLAAQRAALVGKLAERLAAGDAPLAELKDLQDRLRLIDAAQSELRAANDRRLGRALAPVVAVAVALVLAATVPVPVAPVSLELRASSATLTMAEGTSVGPIALAGTSRIEGITTLESPDDPLARAFAAERADALVLRGDEVWLRTLEVPVGARLTVAVGERAQLRVESARVPVHAQLEMRGHTTLRFGYAARVEERRYQQAEWVGVTAGDAKAANGPPLPLALSLEGLGDGAVRLADLRPSSLRFAERRDRGGAVSVVGSSVDGGTITLPATGETVKLAAGDWLEVDGLTAERCEIVLATPLVLRLNGSAGTLRLRVGDFERSLKPSWLEYISRHHLVHLLWGSAAVLWGALAWMRKQFAGVN
jgi:hypothetical protein